MGFDSLLASADDAVLEHLGSVVTYAPGTGAAVDVSGVFDASFVKVDAGQAGVSSCGPAVWLLMADLPSDPREDEPTITVDGVAYTVTEAQADGKGGVLLLLRQES